MYICQSEKIDKDKKQWKKRKNWKKEKKVKEKREDGEKKEVCSLGIVVLCRLHGDKHKGLWLAIDG